MIVTCGVIVTDGEQLLICHPTNGRTWDLPKGRKEPDEEDADAAVRELREETGIVADPDRLILLGHYAYKKQKQLVLYKLRLAHMPAVEKFICTSTFEMYGKHFPEMDAFAVVSKAVALEKLNSDLARIVDSVDIS